MQLAAQLCLLLFQPPYPPLVGLGGQAVLQAALHGQVHLVLPRLTPLPRELPQATPV